MTKDRLPELQEYIGKHNDGETISTINYFAILDMQQPFMSDFFDQVNVLRDSINKLAELVHDVQHLQHAMLAPKAVTETKEKLEEKMTKIKLLGNNIRISLKQMKQSHEIKTFTNEKNVYQRIIEAHVDSITKYFCTIMDKYYQSVITYRERCKINIAHRLQIVGIERTDDEIEEILEKGRLTLFPEIIIETQQARHTLDHVELRHQDLIELEQNIRELHDMFLDLAYVLHAQGSEITNIDDKIFNIGQPGKIYPVKKLFRKRFASFVALTLSRLFASCF